MFIFRFFNVNWYLFRNDFINSNYPFIHLFSLALVLFMNLFYLHVYYSYLLSLWFFIYIGLAIWAYWLILKFGGNWYQWNRNTASDWIIDINDWYQWLRRVFLNILFNNLFYLWFMSGSLLIYLILLCSLKLRPTALIPLLSSLCTVYLCPEILFLS